MANAGAQADAERRRELLDRLLDAATVDGSAVLSDAQTVAAHMDKWTALLDDVSQELYGITYAAYLSMGRGAQA